MLSLSAHSRNSRNSRNSLLELLSLSLSSIILADCIVFSTVPEYVGDMSCCTVPWYDQEEHVHLKKKNIIFNVKRRKAADCVIFFFTFVLLLADVVTTRRETPRKRRFWPAVSAAVTRKVRYFST